MVLRVKTGRSFFMKSRLKGLKWTVLKDESGRSKGPKLNGLKRLRLSCCGIQIRLREIVREADVVNLVYG